jgi:aldehyde:ferredoxin oxidoreductase
MAQQCGYAGRMLRVDLTAASTAEVSTSDYAGRFLGGRGIAAKIYWDEVSPEAQAFDEGNRLIFALGPLAGIPLLGGSRWGVFGKSPLSLSERFCYSNLGGQWGAALKFAGYDGLVFQGKSDRPVYLFLHDGIVDIKDASSLWGKGARETRDVLKHELGKEARVVTIGPAGENRVTTATLLADGDASGSGGLGAVMGSKRLKAIVIKSRKKEIRVAEPGMLRDITDTLRGLGRGNVLVWGMDFMAQGQKTKKAPCYGCLGNCVRVNYVADNGLKGKFMCQSRFFYLPMALEFYLEENDVPFHATKLCDEFGLDTWALQSTIEWLVRCYRAGILSEEDVGLPMSKVGSLEFIETLVKSISRREGFGDVLAGGLERAAQTFGEKGMLQIKHTNPYDPRLYITNALLFPFEPREPIQQIHEVGLTLAQWASWAKGVEGAHISSEVLRGIARRFWGGEAAADFSTCEGKALAAKKIQDRQYVKESLMLCDWMFPLLDIPNSEDHVGDPALESKIVSAVLGNDLDEASLNRIGERVLNLQRAVLAREGHRGRPDDRLPDEWHTSPLETHVADPDCLAPGKNGEPISRVGAVVERQAFERMKDEYYQLRGWDVATGRQTRKKLDELELNDLVEALDHRGLMAGSEESC